MSERDPKLTPDEEQWLDRMLQAPGPIEPSAALRRAVAEIPLRHPRSDLIEAGRAPSLGAWPASALRYALLAALASIAVGAWLGYQGEVLPEVALEDSAQMDDEWEELSLLAFADEVGEELEP
jgi:hypothetical protein